MLNSFRGNLISIMRVDKVKSNQKCTNTGKNLSAKCDVKILRKRAKYDAPALETLIDIINLSPFKESLPPLDIKSSEAYADPGGWTRKARINLRNKLFNQPVAFQNFIWGDTPPYFKDDEQPLNTADLLFMFLKEGERPDLAELWLVTLQSIERYEWFSRMQTKLRHLIRFSISLQEHQPTFEGFAPAPVLGETRISIDANGIAKVQPDEFSEAIDGLDLRRIRSCKICDRILWAKRNDTFTCSPKHGKALAMREMRKNWKKNGHAGKGGYRSNRNKKIK